MTKSGHLPLLTCRARPVITVDVSIFLPASINITAPQCHDGQQPVNCLNVTVCFSFRGRHVPGEIGNEPASQGSQLKWACGGAGQPGDVSGVSKAADPQARCSFLLSFLFSFCRPFPQFNATSGSRTKNILPQISLAQMYVDQTKTSLGHGVGAGLWTCGNIATGAWPSGTFCTVRKRWDFGGSPVSL